MSFKEAIATVKRAYSIDDYIQQSGVSLKRTGAGKSVGLCPFHSEKTPSFAVNDQFQNFRCFGCGASGDILIYVQRTENLDFVEALTKLADDKGIEISLDGVDSSVDYRSLRALLKDAANFFHREFKKLPEDHVAVKEVTDRGLSVKAMLYGYAPDGNALYKFLSSQGYTDELIVQAGVCAKSDKSGRVFDFWQGRLMFFVTDITGKPIGFSGRQLFEDSRGKYVNSPETPLFYKSSSLYNVQNAKTDAFSEKVVHVTEGQFDVGAFVESGMKNTVASLGTAFTEKQGLICRRLVGSDGRIVFCFDGDQAGIDAAVKVFKHIPSIHAQSYVVNFPDKQDPCDFRQANGADTLNAYVLKNQKPMVEFILDVIAGKHDLETNLGVARYIDEAATVLKTISSQTLREVFAKKVALDSFSNIDTVKKAVSIAKPMIDPTVHNVDESEDAEKAVRPEVDVDDELDQDVLIEMIAGSNDYNAAARLIAISLLYPQIIRVLIKSRPFIPADLVWAIDDIAKIEEGVKILAEDFTYSKVMSYIMSENFFPLSDIMQPEDMKEQFIYLREYLKGRKVAINMEIFHRRSAKVLEDSTDIAMLTKVLDKENTYRSMAKPAK